MLEAKKLLKSATANEDIVQDVSSSEAMSQIARKLQEVKATMHDFPTSRLWFQYMEMVAILQRFIKAERTGNWDLHLVAVREMLPFFAASGHNLYAKSAHLYLQKMDDLPKSHPDIHNSFQSGYHVVRRSNRYWAGLSTDLVIEQVLMRSLKTTGGLTQGRGMTELQRSIWLLSMPASAEINFAMQELTDVK